MTTDTNEDFITLEDPEESEEMESAAEFFNNHEEDDSPEKYGRNEDDGDYTNEDEDNEDTEDLDDLDSLDDLEEEKDEIDNSKEDPLDDEIKLIETKLDALSQRVDEQRFPRAESKTDFASGIINSHESKKICNLDEDEIYDLAEKRKFFNFLKYFGWDGLAQRVISNVRDVEDYSLSKKAKLLDSVFIERVKQDSRSIQEERNNKRRFS